MTKLIGLAVIGLQMLICLSHHAENIKVRLGTIRYLEVCTYVPGACKAPDVQGKNK